MPFGDRTGPLGAGPRTGRGLGYCSGYPYPGYMNPAARGPWFRLGCGFGFGGGRGWRHMYWATGVPGWARAGWWGWYDPYMVEPLSPADEKALLERRAKEYERMAAELRKRAAEIKEEK